MRALIVLVFLTCCIFLPKNSNTADLADIVIYNQQSAQRLADAIGKIAESQRRRNTQRYQPPAAPIYPRERIYYNQKTKSYEWGYDSYNPTYNPFTGELEDPDE